MSNPSFPIEDQLVLHLCRRGVNPDLVAGIAEQRTFDWDCFLTTIRKHRVAAPVLASLLDIPVEKTRQKFLRKPAMSEIRAVIHDNRVFQAEILQIVRKLEANNLDCMLLKGLSLDVSGIRYMGDIDLMVREKDLLEAMEAILGIDGYAYRPANRDGTSGSTLLTHPLSSKEKRCILRQTSWNNEFQFIHVDQGVMVELHHRPFQPRNPRGQFSEIPEPVLGASRIFWSRKRYSEELECHFPAPEHSLILMCLKNAIKHSPANGTFRLSVLVDIDNLVRRGIPWDSLMQDCEQLEAAPFVLFSLCLAKNLLGTPVPSFVFKNLKARLTPKQIRAVRLHRRSLTSLNSSSVVYSKLYQAIRPSAFGGSFGQRIYWGSFLPLWVPTRQRIAALFGLRPHSPLLPLAYVINPFRWLYTVVRDAIRP